MSSSRSRSSCCIAATAEETSTPLVLAGADSEIVAGATEYSGMRFGFFFAEYVNVFILSA